MKRKKCFTKWISSLVKPNLFLQDVFYQNIGRWVPHKVFKLSKWLIDLQQSNHKDFRLHAAVGKIIIAVALFYFPCLILFKIGWQVKPIINISTSVKWQNLWMWLFCHLSWIFVTVIFFFKVSQTISGHIAAYQSNVHGCFHSRVLDDQ